MYYTPEILLNHVFEDLHKTKAPNTFLDSSFFSSFLSSLYVQFLFYFYLIIKFSIVGASPIFFSIKKQSDSDTKDLGAIVHLER
jgi:hypothetical protein